MLGPEAVLAGRTFSEGFAVVAASSSLSPESESSLLLPESCCPACPGSAGTAPFPARARGALPWEFWPMGFTRAGLEVWGAAAAAWPPASDSSLLLSESSSRCPAWAALLAGAGGAPFLGDSLAGAAEVALTPGTFPGVFA